MWPLSRKSMYLFYFFSVLVKAGALYLALSYSCGPRVCSCRSYFVVGLLPSREARCFLQTARLMSNYRDVRPAGCTTYLIFGFATRLQSCFAFRLPGHLLPRLLRHLAYQLRYLGCWSQLSECAVGYLRSLRCGVKRLLRKANWGRSVN